jgi:hypothetical protein
VLATGGGDGTVRLWDPAAHAALGDPLTGHTNWVTWGCWGQVEGRQVLATGSVDGTVRLWDPTAHAALGDPLTGHSDSVIWGCWGEVQGRPVLATGGGEGTVRLWDPTAHAALGDPLTGHSDSVIWGCWGQVEDRPVLATGGVDGTVRLWDPTAHAALGDPLTGHTGEVIWGCWGQADGRPVLATGSGSYDGTVRLWDPAAHAPLGPPLTGHTDWAFWGCWGQVEDRPVLATGDTEGMVRLWELCEERLVSLPSYRSDVGSEPDRLARGAEAAALAELITARSARPPLAIGVFGDWGEGKSHFLGQLRSQVHDRSQHVAFDDELTHRAVRQVWFNAWHYAETDLWASLVAELFRQLAAPAEPGVSVADEQRRQSRLATEVIARRGLQERLVGAQARLDKLRELSRPAGGTWERLPEDLRGDLKALAGSQPEQLYLSLSGAGWLATRKARLAWAVAHRIRPRWWVLAAAVAVTVGVFIAVFAAPARQWLSGLVAAAAAVATLANPAWDAWEQISKLRKRVGTWVDAQQARLDLAVKVAAEGVADLQRQLQSLTAGGQLAGLVAEQAQTGSYRSRLGLMTQIRTDFERMAQLLAQASREPATDEVGDPLPAIDRIVVYIDDLDRCPPERVVDMLEAINLLLAVELFVVVVAVDPRWLLQALQSHYQDQLTAPTPDTAVTGDEEALWRPSAVQYLEKIFQVVLTLPPLATGGYVTLVDSLINPQDETTRTANGRTGDSQQPPPPDTREPAAPETSRDTGDDTHTDSQQEDPGPGTGTVDLPAPRIVERSDPLAFSGEEQRMLHLLGPPLITTPRAAKRLANSYGLLSALRSADLAASRDGDQPSYRAAMVLLATLIGYPELGPALFPHIHQRAATNPTALWTQLVTGMQPRHDGRTWCNAVRDGLDETQAQQWQSLARALCRIEEQAGKEGIPLPGMLATWSHWIQHVGRLSFPTGRVVSTLDRHPPLPATHTEPARGAAASPRHGPEPDGQPSH